MSERKGTNITASSKLYGYGPSTVPQKNKVCVCGHACSEHAELIDNQFGSPDPEVQRRHCLHDCKDRSEGTIFGCACQVFREAGLGDDQP